jgi:hypothetical protein
VSIKLASSIIGALKMLMAGDCPFSDWSTPSSWKNPDSKPLELEEYLKDKWRTGLAEVIQDSIENVGWWNNKRDIFALPQKGTLCRVQNFPWQPVRKQYLPAFLVFKAPTSLLEVLDEVS